MVVVRWDGGWNSGGGGGSARVGEALISLHIRALCVVSFV